MPTTVIDTARDVLLSEAAALTTLADSLPADFEAAAQLILDRNGKVVVGGVGKSGHIGRKIAATLSSTGSPAFFIHPTEAAHGDLGMIEEHDTALLISNSGETSELLVMIEFCQRFDIPIIGISSVPGSTLMLASQCQLLLPKVPEACPIRLAPMTSTTMTLALGDALAVALMKARGFEIAHYRDFHPGGKLGAQMSRVADLMHGRDALPLVEPDMPMPETLLVMSAKGFGIAAVVAEDGALMGIVTDGDLRRNMDALMQRSAGQIATKHPVTVTPDVLAARALAMMNERKISVLLVVDDAGHPEGVLHIHDLLRAGVA